MQKLKELYKAHTALVWSGVAIIGFILIVVGLQVPRAGEKEVVAETETSAASQKTVIDAPKGSSTSGVSVSVYPAKWTTHIIGLSYGEAVKEYGSRRIQFNETCSAIPAQSVYKNGTTVMFDNRSNSARVLKLDGTSLELGAYGYTSVTLSYPTLPHTVMIDCGAQKNAATILVQE